MLYIAGELSAEEAKKKWKNLYDTYRRLRNTEKNQASGSGAKKPKRKWHHYDHMSFLNDLDLQKKYVSSNILKYIHVT